MVLRVKRHLPVALQNPTKYRPTIEKLIELRREMRHRKRLGYESAGELAKALTVAINVLQALGTRPWVKISPTTRDQSENYYRALGIVETHQRRVLRKFKVKPANLADQVARFGADSLLPPGDHDD